MLSGKKILGIVAHPDDEFVYGWPIMQDASIDRCLVISMDDHTKYGNKKRDAARIACHETGIRLVNHISSDGAYFRMIRKPKTHSPVKKINMLIALIADAIAATKPDYLFTHNPWGESGNSDHQLISSIVINTFTNLPVLITDIRHYNPSWFSFKEMPRMWKGICGEHNMISRVKIDKDFYVKGKKIYTKFGMWTSSREWPTNYPADGICGIYEIKGD